MLGQGLARALGQAGHVVRWRRSGKDALNCAREGRYDCVILDIGLPDISGIEVLRQLRMAHDDTPVVILSARDRQEQKIAGLDAGADDYLTKPVDLDELLARIRVQARRRSGQASAELTVGEVVLDTHARTVSKAGAPIALAGRDYRLLALLMRRANRFVSRSEIEAELYDHATEIGSNTIETAIYALRRKFGQDFVVTARGLGYMVRG